MLQVDAIPTCGFLKSSSSKPTACNIARLGAFAIPSTIIDENLRVLSFAMSLTFREAF
jgi:hypothetical protein